MTYELQNRLNTLNSRFKEINPQTITLRRGGDSTAGIVASPILRKAEDVALSGAIIRTEYQRFAIDVSDYVLSSVEVIPEAGDIIEYADGSRFQVVKFNDAESAYEYTTSSHERYLINTAKIRNAI